MDNDITEPLQNAFLQDLTTNCRTILSLGQPDSGKSFTALKFITWALNNNIYEEYHLVLPQFTSEQNDSYSFLKNYKKIVSIYPTYHEVVAQRILKIMQTKKILFLIDDATGMINADADPSLKRLFTMSRHGAGCTTWIIAHGSKKIISKTIRGVVKYIFLYSFESDAVLQKDIYDEFLSMIYRKHQQNFDNFFQDYSQVMDSNDYGVILIARRTKVDENQGPTARVDFNVNYWELLTIEENKKVNVKQSKPNIEVNDTTKKAVSFPSFFSKK